MMSNDNNNSNNNKFHKPSFWTNVSEWGYQSKKEVNFWPGIAFDC